MEWWMEVYMRNRLRSSDQDRIEFRMANAGLKVMRGRDE